MCCTRQSHLFVLVIQLKTDFQTHPSWIFWISKSETTKYQHSAWIVKIGTWIWIPLISSSLFKFPSKGDCRPSFYVCSSFTRCLRLSEFIYLSVSLSLPLFHFQHISSRRHKDRAAGKPAKPKFSPYSPTQRHQSFQAVSIPLFLDLLSLISVFGYMSWFFRAFSRKLYSLLPMKQIVSDMVLKNLLSEMFYSYDAVRTKGRFSQKKEQILRM